MAHELFTIGYSSFGLDSFLQVLKRYEITAVVDVRSAPYSRVKAEFNRERLGEFLPGHRIVYVFLGDYCGARVEDAACYVNGKVDFALVSETSKFKAGLQRIRGGLEQYRLALMCAEKDPLACHRTILICRNLVASGLEVKHILGDGLVEAQRDTEIRLLALFGLNQPDLFRTERQRLNDAYRRQGEKIAFVAP